MQESLDLLAGVRLFEGLSKRELRPILDRAKPCTFEPRAEIVREGEDGVGFHVIVEGRARVSRKGRTQAMLGPGDFFGELALIDPGKRSATVAADSLVRTLSLVSWDFLPLLEKHPSIARKLLVEVCRRLRDTQADPTL